jgi:hypothetical protein
MIKRTIIFCIAISSILFGFKSSAQENISNVTITASGRGTSQAQAQQYALRSAIEQAYGAFISSKTEILNDEIVADQMASVASGNIQSFEILNETELPDHSWASTIKAAVSVEKLTSFVQSKGIEVEIKGGLFAANIKQQMLNEQGEVEAIYNMVGVLHEVMQTAFDFKIVSKPPQAIDQSNLNWKIPLEIQAIANQNIDFCNKFLNETLNSLSLSSEAISDYSNINKEIYKIEMISQKGKGPQTILKTYNLRTKTSIDIICTLLYQWRFYNSNCAIDNGLKKFTLNYKNCESRNSLDFSNFSFPHYAGGDWWEPKYKGKLTVNFPLIGETTSTIYYIDKLSLNEIEKIESYKILPNEISRIEHGGYTISDEPEHDLIVAITDQGFFSWQESQDIIQNISIANFNDWRLPTLEELEIINTELYQNGLGHFSTGYYWSSTLNPTPMNAYSSEENKRTFYRTFCFSGNNKNEGLVSSNVKMQLRLVRDVWTEQVDESKE